jgi:hypothetical protein
MLEAILLAELVLIVTLVEKVERIIVPRQITKSLSTQVLATEMAMLEIVM